MLGSHCLKCLAKGIISNKHMWYNFCGTGNSCIRGYIKKLFFYSITQLAVCIDSHCHQYQLTSIYNLHHNSTTI